MPIIGNTPLIKLTRLSEPGCADIYVKYEGGNPTGSMKDRMALSMIEGAERRGELKPGGTILEYTGGSTGCSLAMVAATKGYKAKFVSSDAFSEEKLQMMKAFGAELIMVPSEGGMITGDLLLKLVARAKELSAEPNIFWTDQFNNVDNRNAYHAMAREIISELGSFDEFITGIGTGGSFSGNSEIFKKEIPGVKCIAIEPDGVRTFSGGDKSGKHRLEGIGNSFVTAITRTEFIDDVVQVTDADAYTYARRLAREEGIFGGTTSGANVWAAVQRARKLGPDKKVVTLICDSGLKYLKGDLYK